MKGSDKSQTSHSLTRKVDTQGGDLTTTSGSRISTKSKGDVIISFEVNPNLGGDLRRLQAGDNALVGTTLVDKQGIRDLFGRARQSD